MPAQRDPQAAPWSLSCRQPGLKPSSDPRGWRWCQCYVAKAGHRCPSTLLPPTRAATLHSELGSCLRVRGRPLPPGQTSSLAAAPGSVGPNPGPEQTRGPLPGQSPLPPVAVASRHLGLPTVPAGHQEHCSFWNFQSQRVENAPPPSAWVPHLEVYPGLPIRNWFISASPKYHHHSHPTPQTPPQSGMEVSL